MIGTTEVMPRYRTQIFEGVVLCCTCRELKSDLGCESFVAIANHGRDSRKCGELFWGALRVATRRDNSGFGIVAVSSTYPCPCFAICFGSDAAGVDDDNVGSGGRGFGGSGISKKSGYGFSIGTGGPAAKVLDVEGGGHRVSLMEQRG